MFVYSCKVFFTILSATDTTIRQTTIYTNTMLVLAVMTLHINAHAQKQTNNILPAFRSIILIVMFFMSTPIGRALLAG